jgi:undecaprenyl diphosphate synthase
MDGNGRWAAAHGRERTAGHRAGAEAVRRIVTAVAERGIPTLTLYAFSSDNWQRPGREVQGLMTLFTEYLRDQVGECRTRGVRLRVIGRRDRLPLALRAAITGAERATAHGRALDLRLAVDYSARDAILAATNQAQRRPGHDLTREQFAALLGSVTNAHAPSPDVDLLIRTGGEQRLSDFLLWECAYAELVFSSCYWPDFGERDLDLALDEFRRRERRFGLVGERAGS